MRSSLDLGYDYCTMVCNMSSDEHSGHLLSYPKSRDAIASKNKQICILYFPFLQKLFPLRQKVLKIILISRDRYSPVELPVMITPSDLKNLAALAVSTMLTSEVTLCAECFFLISHSTEMFSAPICLRYRSKGPAHLRQCWNE